MNIKDLLPIPDLEGCSSLLCIQPHPDDNEVGAGATIAKLAARGCSITYLTVLDGAIGTLDPDAKPGELAAVRKNEVEKSAAFLGVTRTLFLDLPDGGYSDEKLLCQRIVEIIRQVKPEMVMAPDPFMPYECHPDHRRVGMAAAEACLFSMFPGFKTDCGHAPAFAPNGIAFHTTIYPNTFVGVDETWEKKLQALEIHESQFPKPVLEQLGMYFAYKASGYAEGKPFALAEAFKVLSGNHMHMNVDTIHL